MNEENKKSPRAQKEEEILKFWQDKQIFQKSLDQEAPKGEYVFYDGPPFATGLPHYGHILGSTAKDMVGRYKTMRGFKVPRRWGWDCHGLPIENIVEKDLGISGKKAIEEFGIDKFVNHAKSKVLTYVAEWKKTVDRMGRWVDFDNSYKTMDNTYIESVWWALGEINKKGLLYEGVRVLAYCPRCETPIANSEIAMDNSYKDISDISVTVKFELKDEPRVFLLVWTTTPWTLPGNTAIAVNKDIDYVKIKVMSSGENYILAKSLLSVIKDNYAVIEEFRGEKLIGKSYKPVFDYYKTVDMPDKENIWKIWHADFVTLEKGTGIAHEAPAFGEEDMELAKEFNIPFIRHVAPNGTFTKEVKDFFGEKVKPKDDKATGQDHQRADILIIKYLAGKGTLFAKEKIVHSYPHCYRCDTPLLYYALPSWFVNIQKVKNNLLKTGEDMNWVPAHLKEGRFHNSMESAPDWTISRNRYWASPLPIWKSLSGKLMFVNSLEDLKLKTKKSGNNLFIIRHGEADNNILGIISSNIKTPHHLTEKGKAQVRETAEKLKDKKIDLIYVSPFIRTQETAKIIADILHIPANKIITDNRLHEVDSGALDGKTDTEYQSYFKTRAEKFTKNMPGGENYLQIRNRMTEFVYEADSKNKNKNILIIGHRTPIRMMFTGISGMSISQAIDFGSEGESFIKNSEVKELNFVPVPHNENYELDLHRPYIDQIILVDEKGEEYKRIPEVIDCWFESGSMPFAQDHFPFENLDKFNPNPGFLRKRVGFPAEFVAEYIAQTRTWFYYSHTISTILFDHAPFKNIVTTGNVLALDGNKMSKSKNNYPDPWILFNKYGVDALRFYLMSSPLMKGEDLCFNETGVDEVGKKVLSRLENVFSFYDLYSKNVSVPVKNFTPISNNILDQWIIARLTQLISMATVAMDKYELDQATWPIADFVDDLSTWYLRRSRDRFKSDDLRDKTQAIETTRFVLEELAKIMAPVMPFYADELYQKVKSFAGKESVHLASWPEVKKLTSAEEGVLVNMAEIRKIVSLGLEARAKANIKVRQPLKSLKCKNQNLKLIEKEEKNYKELIRDEVNVKEVFFDNTISEPIELDTNITPELKEEGNVRELLRAIQELRKTEKLNPSDIVSLKIKTDKKGQGLVRKFEAEIKKTTLVKSLTFNDTFSAEVIKIDDLSFELKILR